MARRLVALSILLCTLSAFAYWLVARGDGALPGSANVPARGVVIYVDAPEFAKSGMVFSETVRKTVSQLLPGEQWDWQFIANDPEQDTTLVETIARVRPRLVIFATTDLFRAVAKTPRETNFLMSSDWPVETLTHSLQLERKANRFAVISWFPTSHSKELELIAAFAPNGLRLIDAFFTNLMVEDGSSRYFETAAKSRGVEVRSVIYQNFDEVRRALLSVPEGGKPDALFLPLSPVLTHNAAAVAMLAAQSGLPGVYTRGDQVDRGGLIATASPPREVSQQIALYAALILHGVDPSALEIGTPSRLEMTVNLSAATQIGRPVPYELLVEATEIVE